MGYLVLSRTPEQRVIIHNQETEEVIALLVIDIRPGKVRIGLDAPDKYRILREELLER